MLSRIVGMRFVFFLHILLIGNLHMPLVQESLHRQHRTVLSNFRLDKITNTLSLPGMNQFGDCIAQMSFLNIIYKIIPSLLHLLQQGLSFV